MTDVTRLLPPQHSFFHIVGTTDLYKHSQQYKIQGCAKILRDLATKIYIERLQRLKEDAIHIKRGII